MKSGLSLIGVLAPLLLANTVSWADWRAMSGAKPILPTRFTPMGYEVIERRPAALPPRRRAAGVPTAAVRWSFPLVDRVLSPAEKAAELAPELIEAIRRVEPMYDPTRLDGTGAAPPMSVSAGTAVMYNVFADRWRRASPDPNVHAKVRAIATAWQTGNALACDAFMKKRPHLVGDPALNDLDVEDCRRLRRYQGLGFRDVMPVPIVVASISVPVFAAPLPGARLSSRDFWAVRKAQIDAIQARLHQKWQTGAALSHAEMGLRP